MDHVKRSKLSFAILSAGYILLGLLRLFFPDPKSQMLCYVLGGIAIVMGIIRVTIFFSRHDPNRVFHHDLAIGITLLCVGIYLVARPADVSDLFPVLLGFCILFDSVIKMQYAFEMRRTEMKTWYIILVAAVLTAIAGILLVIRVFNGTTLVYYLGVVLVADGVVNLVALLLMSMRLKKQSQAGGASGKKKPAGAAPAVTAQAAPVSPPVPPLPGTPGGPPAPGNMPPQS